jgi:hypothetical protein
LTEKVIPDREVISGHVLQAAEKAFREKVLEEVNTMIDVKKDSGGNSSSVQNRDR